MALNGSILAGPASFKWNNDSGLSNPLRWYDSDENAFVGLKCAGTITASVDYILPAAGPAADGYALSCTVGGVMSWIAAPGTGTVTSVALTAPSFINVAGSPITTSGTLALTFANQDANTALLGPTSGAAAAPTFRGFVAADIQDLAPTWTAQHNWVTASTVPQLVLADSATDAATKRGYVATKHYTNAEEPLGMLTTTSTSTLGLVNIGGGLSQVNAATNIRLYTAANNITTTGTLRMEINSSGVVNIANLTVSKPVFTDGSSNLVSTGTLAVDQGGTGNTTGQATLNNGEVFGVGTAHNISGSTYVRVDFGTTDAEVTLSTAGTYLVTAICGLVNNGVTAEAWIELFNSTSSTPITGERKIYMLAGDANKQMIVQNLITVSASNVIQIYAKSPTAAVNIDIIAALTSISYVKISP